MFACLVLAPGAVCSAPELVALARAFSPRIEVLAGDVVVLDVDGFGTMFGDAHAIGEALRRDAAECRLPVNVAVAATRVAAILMAHVRAGLTIVPPGAEAIWLASLPLCLLTHVVHSSRFTIHNWSPVKTSDTDAVLRTLSRWGLKTLGDLVALPAPDLFERLGETGVVLRQLARGEDIRPFVPDTPEEQFEESLELEWPVDRLEPLAFALGRLLDPLCARLERRCCGVGVLHVRLQLVSRKFCVRTLRIPAPIYDPRVLRTLIMLDLESHLAARTAVSADDACSSFIELVSGIEGVTISVEPVRMRVVQFSLLERAHPSPEQISTLIARMETLVEKQRCGAPVLMDVHRPGAFEVEEFAVTRPAPGTDRRATRAVPVPGVQRRAPGLVLRRFRPPVSARVTIDAGRPVRVVAMRGFLKGGNVEVFSGPWRTSGLWWRQADKESGGQNSETGQQAAGLPVWDLDEWDVALSDGGVYRIYRDRAQDQWFVDGVID